MKSVLIIGLMCIALLLPAAGCREEGPLEKAGKEMDDAVDRIRHGDEGTLEKAGRETDEAIEEAKEDWEEEEKKK